MGIGISLEDAVCGWIQLALSRDQWLQLVNTAIKLFGSINAVESD
jgi:hypothetical protein